MIESMIRFSTAPVVVVVLDLLWLWKEGIVTKPYFFSLAVFAKGEHLYCTGFNMSKKWQCRNAVL